MSIIDTVLGRSVICALILCGTAILSPSPSPAQTCLGSCGEVGADGDVTESPEGGSYRYITTASSRRGVGQVKGIGGFNGSEYWTPHFAAAPGDTIDFYFQFVTTDAPIFYDYGFAELLDGAPACRLSLHRPGEW